MWLYTMYLGTWSTTIFDILVKLSVVNCYIILSKFKTSCQLAFNEEGCAFSSLCYFKRVQVLTVIL